jgi:hypothetical protein
MRLKFVRIAAVCVLMVALISGLGVIAYGVGPCCTMCDGVYTVWCVSLIGSPPDHIGCTVTGTGHVGGCIPYWAAFAGCFNGSPGCAGVLSDGVTPCTMWPYNQC